MPCPFTAYEVLNYLAVREELPQRLAIPPSLGVYSTISPGRISSAATNKHPQASTDIMTGINRQPTFIRSHSTHIKEGIWQDYLEPTESAASRIRS